jgi:hypothetical protein
MTAMEQQEIILVKLSFYLLFFAFKEAFKLLEKALPKQAFKCFFLKKFTKK